jgi:hypothetical protein
LTRIPCGPSALASSLTTMTWPAPRRCTGQLRGGMRRGHRDPPSAIIPRAISAQAGTIAPPTASDPVCHRRWDVVNLQAPGTPARTKMEGAEFAEALQSVPACQVGKIGGRKWRHNLPPQRHATSRRDCRCRSGSAFSRSRSRCRARCQRAPVTKAVSARAAYSILV